MKPYKPRGFNKYMAEVDVTPQEYASAQAFFLKRGITLNYVEKARQCWFSGFPCDLPAYFIIKCGSLALREYLDAPSEVLKAFQEQAENIRNTGTYSPEMGWEANA